MQQNSFHKSLEHLDRKHRKQTAEKDNLGIFVTSAEGTNSTAANAVEHLKKLLEIPSCQTSCQPAERQNPERCLNGTAQVQNTAV